ncbi:TonB-dependent siderophore receptor [Methylopila musalis]|uniref:TonB-dependent siderophore receptor n=1 Tax=Methylopila musalis TaxID=1134781 RepID=A0ABW3Z6V4_9HYPH
MTMGVGTRAGHGAATGRWDRRLVCRLLTGTMIGCAGLGLPAAALAQQAGQSASAQGRVVDFAIPAQPIPGAIDAFIRQSGWQIGYSSRIADGLRSTAVAGRLPPAQALRTILAGAGIDVRVTGANTATLVASSMTTGSLSEDAIALDPIDVLGDSQNPFGHVDGYVATRSSSGAKTDTPLIRTPQTVNVVTRDQIKDQGAQTLGDAVQYTPGVIVQEGFNRTDDPFILRGFDVRTNPGVMYRDGLKVPLPHYSVAVEPYGIERVEILKGPASVLFGQAAPGGVVNTITKRPTATPFGEVNVTYGSYARKQASFDVGGPLDSDGAWKYRVTGLGRDSGTMIDHVPDDRYYVAPALTWSPNADTELTLLASHMVNKTVNNAGYPFSGTVASNPNGKIGSDVFTGEPGWSKWDQSVSTLGYQLSHRFNDVFQFRQNVLAGTSKTKINHAYTWSWVTGSNQSLLERGAYSRTDDAWGVSVDNQLQATFDTGPVAHSVLIGLDYTRASLERLQFAGYNNLSPLNPFAPVYGSSVVLPSQPNTHTLERRNQLGLYAQDQITIDDRLILLLGGRYDLARAETTNRLTDVVTKTDDNAFTGRAGLVYLFDNGLAPYVSYSTSFQPQSGTTSAARGSRPFDPTTGQQWEAGIKYQPLGWNGMLTASVFEITRQNVPTVDPNDPSFNIQEGEVRARGVELSAVANVTESLKIVAAYTYTDAEVTKSNGADRGRTPAAVPRNAAALWLDYAFGTGPLRGLKIGGGVRYIGETLDTTNAYKVSAYTLADATIEYDFGARNPALHGVSVAVSAKNLFDKEFVSSCTYACFYGERRSVYGTLSYKW